MRALCSAVVKQGAAQRNCTFYTLVRGASDIAPRVTREQRHMVGTLQLVTVTRVFICEHFPRILLKKRAAHPPNPSDVRQIARKPHPPIELLIVHFS
jgi:hypothetical protein